MSETLKEKQSTLRDFIDRQRNAIEALKREGHECPDAERALRHLLNDLKLTNDNSSTA